MLLPKLKPYALDDTPFNLDKIISPITTLPYIITPPKSKLSILPINPPLFTAFNYEEDVTLAIAL